MSGVDWSQVGINAAAFATLASVAGLATGSVIKGVRGEIKQAVKQLGDILDERLATKEQMNALAIKVAVVEEKVKENAR